MPRHLMVVGGTTYNQGTGTTIFYPPSGLLYDAATEATVRQVVRESYTLSKLSANVESNTRTAASTLKLRKNGADGNMNVSVGAATSGYFTDAVNTDSLVSGNDFNYQTNTTGGANSLTWSTISCLANGTPILIAYDEGVDVTQNAGTTVYSPFTGVADHNTGAQYTPTYVYQNVVVDRMMVYVDANTCNQIMTVTFMDNGIAGNQTISVGAGLTGLFEDTVNTDTLTSGQYGQIRKVIPAGAGSVSVVRLAVRASVDTGRILACTWPFTTISFGEVWYVALEGSPVGTTTDIERTQALDSFTAKNLYINILDNTMNGATVFAFRVNGVNSALSISIPASTDGLYTDSDSVILSATDTLNYIKDGSASGAGSIRMHAFGVQLDPISLSGGMKSNMAARLVGARCI